MCSVENCKKAIYIKNNGLCCMHNARFKKYGDPLKTKNRWDNHIKSQKSCYNTTCSNLIWKGKFCSKCKARKNRTGDINGLLGRRRLEYDENILKRDNKESHYFIGWVAADGYISEKYMSFKLEICDLEILENFKRILNYSGEIKLSVRRKEHHKQAYRLNLCDHKLIKDFINIGIRQRKSKTIEMPKINQKHFYHFLRGLIEGDGSIICGKYLDKRRNKSYNRFFVFINSGSKKMLEQISEICMDTCPITTFLSMPRKGYGNHYRLIWSGAKALKLCELLYKDSENLRLDRKYQKYIQYKNLTEMEQ